MLWHWHNGFEVGWDHCLGQRPQLTALSRPLMAECVTGRNPSWGDLMGDSAFLVELSIEYVVGGRNH